MIEVDLLGSGVRVSVSFQSFAFTAGNVLGRLGGEELSATGNSGRRNCPRETFPRGGMSRGNIPHSSVVVLYVKPRINALESKGNYIAASNN